MSRRISKGSAWLLSVLLVGLALMGCSTVQTGKEVNKTETGQAAENSQSTINTEVKVVTDLVGREVKVKIPAQRIVAVGPGSLRLVAYAKGTNRVVGIENMEKKDQTGRPYLFAYPELTSLPTIGQGGIDSVPDEEALLSVKPDVIFASYLVDKAKAADNLQAKTGIPVVVLSYGPLATFNEEDVYRSLDLVGRVIGTQQRAEEVITYVKSSKADLAERTKGIPDSAKPKVYVGALGVKGTQGIESTQAKYPPFMYIGARNVADETGKSGSLMIEQEKLVSWDPDILFIDEGGNKVFDDAKKNPTFYQSLSAVKNGRVYGQIPYNFYTTNIDTALADAYYAGKVIFPEKFQDIDPVKKSEEIYRFFLGQPVYEQMVKDYGGFKKLDLIHP
ncbi:iron ABC transporter substrate-binding protein [Desulfosporosinus sp. OT]|uniref:iron ABC transporter substrate-binding protein n=1 Tax=Desulfosporosinus sp. OT TaxID=913865 RepID=UPI00058FC628|nr:iron ABC transporter substrate-binding protein [Desulfosporosinus sp. OT]